jgi:hypothetical protein
MKAQLGHDGPPTSPWQENLITGTKLTECPLRTLLRVWDDDPPLAAEFDRHLVTYYPLYRDGHLLTGGGVSDQPAKYLDYMIAIRSMEAAVQTKLDDIRDAERESAGGDK